MNNYYWPVYLNLERDFLKLAEYVHIDDYQLDVYSVKIADMLIRTVVEIESIAKALYFNNGGVKADDNNLHFDRDCFGFLDPLWELGKKEILVVSPSLYLEKKNKTIHPLKHCSKSGSSAPVWARAYQAVKHNRIKELQRGNIWNLLLALGALYILNLYYSDETYEYIDEGKVIISNLSFGSQLFSTLKPYTGVSLHEPINSGEYCKKLIYLAVPIGGLYDIVAQMGRDIQKDIAKQIQEEFVQGYKEGKFENISELEINSLIDSHWKEVSNQSRYRARWIKMGTKMSKISYELKLNKNHNNVS